MANIPVCALGPSSTPGDARCNVYLLPVDSISDLHSIPLDTGTPQEEEVISDAHGKQSTFELPDTPEALSANQPASCSRCGSPCIKTLITFLIVIALVNMCLLLYILHLYRNQDSLLRTLAEKIDTQTDSLRESPA